MEELVDLVMSRLEVSERDYFGLYYAVREQRVSVARGCVSLRTAPVRAK